MLVQGMVGSVTCVAANPLLPRLVVLCGSGDIHLWDYDRKVARHISTVEYSRQTASVVHKLYPLLAEYSVCFTRKIGVEIFRVRHQRRIDGMNQQLFRTAARLVIMTL